MNSPFKAPTLGCAADADHAGISFPGEAVAGPKPLAVMIVAERPSTARHVARLVETTQDAFVVGSAWGENAVEVARRLRPDVIVVEAEAPECGGLRVAAMLDGVDDPAVVVVSAADRFAARAFEIAAIDFLLKPLRPSRFRRSLERARFLRDARDAHRKVVALRTYREAAAIDIPSRHGARSLPICDIVWIQADRDYALIHALSETHMLRSTMAALAARLPSTILRVHRSAFVSTRHVRRWRVLGRGVHGLQLSSGAEVVVSPGYLARVREELRSLSR